MSEAGGKEQGPTPVSSPSVVLRMASESVSRWSARPSRMPQMRSRPGWPLVSLVPTLVIAIGLAVALSIGISGVLQLRHANDAQTEDEASLLATTMAARLGEIPEHAQTEAMRQAAKKTDAEYALVSPDGRVLVDATLGLPPTAALGELMARTHGETVSRGLGRARYFVAPLADATTRLPGATRLIVFVRESSAPEGAPAFITALIALTTLLVGAAAVVAYAVARDATKDIRFVMGRIAGMAHAHTEPTRETVPIRTMDEMAELTHAFNELVDRFAAAEKGYREDLVRAQLADRDRAAFLAAVSHELRSPLNAILGFADVLLTEVDGPLSPDARQEVEQIRGSGGHLLELINDILEFSALETGQLRLSRRECDAAAIAREVVREAAGLVGERRLRIVLEGEASLVIHADAKRVRQVLTNLVGNAIKFTRQGEVKVTVSREGSAARLSVADTGPGISQAERAMIFEEFKQAGEERYRRRGTGLGLAIARRLVLLHGGNIRLESEEGVGSVFIVYLPIRAQGNA